MGKFIFLDIDGTAVSHARNPSYIPEPTEEAVRRLVKNGHAVAFATGRSRATSRWPMEALGISGGVFSNGTHIMVDGRTVFIENIDKQAVQIAVRHILKGNYQAYAADAEVLYVNNASEDSLAYLASQTGGMDFIKPFSEIGSVCKLEYYGGGRPEGIAEGRADVLNAYGGIELRPPGTSKESGIRRFAELRGFSPRDIIAVGDGENDLGMLWEAAVGIAVGGASDEAKSAADIVTGDIEDGGILRVFEGLGLI